MAAPVILCIPTHRLERLPQAESWHLQEHGMRNEAKTSWDPRAAWALPDTGPRRPVRVATPDEKQDQLQTWEGEGGSIAPGGKQPSDTPST